MNKKSGIAILFILVLALVVWLILRNPSESEDEASLLLPKSGEIKVEGEIACLPYKTAAPGNECVKGIKGVDGKIYAINTVPAFDEGVSVTALGKFEPAVENAESSVFQYDGVLVVRKLQMR